MSRIKITDRGVYAPDFNELREENVTAWKSKFPDADTSTDSIDGRIIDIDTEREVSIDSAVQGLANSIDPDGAVGFPLENICGYIGIGRKGNTYSTVECVCTGTPGYTCSAGQIVQIKDGKTNSTKTLINDSNFTFDVSGTAIVEFRTQEYGPLQIDPESVTEIITSLSGWTSITNTERGIPGSNIETDASLKIRRQQSLQYPAAGTGEGIYSRLLALDGVSSLYLFNNNTQNTVQGIPGYHIEAVVSGGDNTEIAETLYFYKSEGASTYGDYTEVVQDYNGDDVLISFSRPEDVEVWAKLQLSVSSDYNLGTFQQYKLEITAANAGDYNITINNTTYTYTAGSSDTVANIAFGLNSAINLGTFAPASSSYISGKDYILITARYQGVGFLTSTDSVDLVIEETAKNSGDTQKVIQNIVDFSQGYLNITTEEGTISGKVEVGKQVEADRLSLPANLNIFINKAELFISTVGTTVEGKFVDVNFKQVGVISPYRFIVEFI